MPDNVVYVVERERILINFSWAWRASGMVAAAEDKWERTMCHDVDILTNILLFQSKEFLMLFLI
uniref:Uncharacterized protein n=1 Tax=Arion vulgaris TaxID=1028688 RepID=A0A0B7B492_9EUPU